MLGLALTFLIIGVWVFSVVDVIGTPADEVKVVPKPIWLIVLVVFFFLGSVCWFVFGRPRAAHGFTGYERHPSSDHPAFGGRSPWAAERRTSGYTRPGLSRAGMRRQAVRPVGPDDDPEFLRELTDRIRGGDTEPPAGRG
ncbi:Phospholipase D-nuclease N-terminal [Frankia sp. EI5c]|uniref:PLD nuclease N-terminal domain-containing protein n=1 Tax=Frankia sp. EI5c TaxID=683316 RepID=UPI0007C2B69A|nr:PLD nuclease N-terminal domain-containing protein [Frankia sp. EI5c]OAA26438.1 Phospholipase D-nuclease N-terminal [Frankia sp. EI5c]